MDHSYTHTTEGHNVVIIERNAYAVFCVQSVQMCVRLSGWKATVRDIVLYAIVHVQHVRLRYNGQHIQAQTHTKPDGFICLHGHSSLHCQLLPNNCVRLQRIVLIDSCMEEFEHWLLGFFCWLVVGSSSSSSTGRIRDSLRVISFVSVRCYAFSFSVGWRWKDAASNWYAHCL